MKVFVAPCKAWGFKPQIIDVEVDKNRRFNWDDGRYNGRWCLNNPMYSFDEQTEEMKKKMLACVEESK